MKTQIYSMLFLIASLVASFSAISQEYVVLTSIDDITDDYFHSVYALSDYRNAEIVTFDPENLDLLLPVLTEMQPRYVAVVLKPEEIHINFIRQFLMLSTQLDSDPFSDFSYGFITGATAQDALDYVYNIIHAENDNIEDYPLDFGGYVATSLNFVYTGINGYESFFNPESSTNIWLETNDNGVGEAFFLANTSHMENKKMLDIGQNGDAHMLWLFDGGNADCDPPSWLYDEAKIEDPAYARVGLTSYDIAPLNLYPAVAFNGACHSGETKSVMVEGDIEATFGDTQGLVEFYTMSDTFSFALSILKTGITGYFAPCGANNANDQSEDVYNAFLYDEPLGDIHKRSNDGVVMGFLGNRPNLRIFEQGESTYQSDVLPSGTFNPYTYSGATYMLGGKANRIYFGDPLYNPYKNDHSEGLKIVNSTLEVLKESTLEITLNMNKPDGFWPVWDKFHFGNTRIYYPVELPAFCTDVSSFEVIESSGPYDLVIHAVEFFDNKTILHIEVDIPNDMYDPIDYTIKFGVNCITTDFPKEKLSNNVQVFPNPATDKILFSFANPKNAEHNLTIYDLTGKIVKTFENNTGSSIECQLFDQNAGMYFYILTGKNGVEATGKFIIE